MSILSYSSLTQAPTKPKVNSKRSIKESYLARGRKYINENRSISSKANHDHIQFMNECTDPKQYFAKFRYMLDTFDRKIYTFTDQMNALQDAFAMRLSMDYKPVDILRMFKTFGEEDEFYFDKYDYTNIDNPLVPSTDSVFDFGEYYDKMKNILISAATLTDKQKYDKLMSLVDDLRINFSDANYQKFRGDIIGLDELIYATDYPEELFNIFRANGTLQCNSLIDMKYMSTINKDILNAKKFINQMNTIKNNIVALYTGIIKKMEPLFDIVYTGTASSVTMGAGHYPLTNEVIQALCVIINLIDLNLSKMMDIHMIAYTSKLDAINNYFEQSIRILDIGWHKATTKNRIYGMNESALNPFYNDIEIDIFDRSVGIEESITRVFENAVFLESAILESEINKARISTLLEADTKKAAKGFAAIKQFLTNIIQKISAVVGKFAEKAMNFVASDKGYLEHYKDIILQHPLAATDISDYYDYNFIELTQIEIPELNYTAMKDQLKDEETFIKARFSKYIKNKEASLKDNIMATIQGDPISIPDTSKEDGKKINRTDLYNYVLNYGKLNGSIKNDQKKFEQAQKTAQAECDRIEKEMQSHEDIKSALDKETQKSSDSDNMSQAVHSNVNQNPTEQPKAGNNGAAQVNASAIIDPMADYFTEMEINKGSNASTGTPDANNPAAANKNAQNSDTSAMSQNYTAAAAEDQKNAMEVADAIKTYFTVGAEVLSAKLTVANAAYKQSMDIIRWHVQNYNNMQGKKETNPNAESNATNYETGEKGAPKEEAQQKSDKKQSFWGGVKNFFS